MLTEDRVYKFAVKCARAYCAQHNAWENYDDAVSAASLYLLEHREKWAQENKGLKRRVVGELQRQYQNEHGLRRKYMPKRVDVNLELIAVRERPPSSVRPDSERLDIVRRALRQPGIVRYAPILEDVLGLKYTKTEIGRRHGVSTARVSQIYKEFKTVCRRLDPYQEVAIIDTTREEPTPEEILSTPLFFYKQTNERPEPSRKALVIL